MQLGEGGNPMGRIPDFVQNVIRTLNHGGFQAWCVGGCVRDTLLGRIPEDWDVATSAIPAEILRLFGDHAVPTGLKHGTVTVRTAAQPVEVTTFRSDGAYADHRHPDQVTFSNSLDEDLERRDFTVNAMAMGLDGVICDPTGGTEDLAAGILRCVGNPDVRFDEDALRILRCLRFAAVLEFSIEPQTEQALRRNRMLLRDIAAERIREEFVKLLCGTSAAEVLLDYPDVLEVFLPEIRPTVGFEQCNRHHCYDVWEHTARSVAAVPPDPILRVTMLLHDLGKPQCFTKDSSGNGHFFGHPAVSRRLGETILRRLHFSNRERETILLLVANHDRVIAGTEKSVRRALFRCGECNLRRLFAVKRADNLAQAAAYHGRQEKINLAESTLDRLLKEDACFSLKQLAVNGRDMMDVGLQGREVGETLRDLLKTVVNGGLPNNRKVLLTVARKRKIQLHREKEKTLPPLKKL